MKECIADRWPDRAAVAAIRHRLRIVGDRPSSFRRIEGHHAIGRIGAERNEAHFLAGAFTAIVIGRDGSATSVFGFAPAFISFANGTCA